MVIHMGIKLSELDIGCPILLKISNTEKSMTLNASIKRHIESNIVSINIADYEPGKLVFDNVQVDLEHQLDNAVPIVWRNIKILTYKSEYFLYTPTDGLRTNKRSFFRVGISMTVQIMSATNGPRQTTIRDLSLSGFSVIDRKKELILKTGDELSIYYKDLGYDLSLIGRVARIDEQEEFILYGLELCNLCKNLSAYLSEKQRWGKKQA